LKKIIFSERDDKNSYVMLLWNFGVYYDQL